MLLVVHRRFERVKGGLWWCPDLVIESVARASARGKTRSKRRALGRGLLERRSLAAICACTNGL